MIDLFQHITTFADQNANSMRYRRFATPHSALHIPYTNCFTVDGSEELERHLARTCRRVGEEVLALIPERVLEAVVLGGGYGRGEGGVWRTPLGDRPYNDLEFYVFVRNNRLVSEGRYRSALAELGERLTPEAGVHVEFKVESLARLRQDSVSMFNYDLVAGHQVILGDEECFQGCEHLLRPEQIPKVEATRLLFNRGTGLLLAQELLQRGTLTHGQADFVGRNLAKAQLALGDAVLTVFRQYHWSCLERRERLSRLTEPLPWWSNLQVNHSAGVKFKLHPRCLMKTVAEFEQALRKLSALVSEVWLWLESRRLERCFDSVQEYARSQPSKPPETDEWRNLALNVKAFGWRAAFDRFAWHYPRERLFRALALLLWESPAGSRNGSTAALQSLLKSRASNRADLAAVYKAAWSRFA